MSTAPIKPDYGVDAPGVLRGTFFIGLACPLFAALMAHFIHGGLADIVARGFFGIAGCLIAAGLLFILYVKAGKFRHRDFMLGLHAWQGDEWVLDVGCGRGLLLVGAAKRIAQLGGRGHVTGIDIWSNTDMGANSAIATEKNLRLEGVSQRCTLVSEPVEEMSFADASFDLIVSNLCLHNIEDGAARRRSIEQIARVLKPGGTAILSDFKLTGEYASQLRQLGFSVERRSGSLVRTFAPLTVVIARKP
jgi:arsenite methyltransferase